MSAFQAVDSVLPAVLVGVVALAVAALSWQTTAKIIGIVLLMVILPCLGSSRMRRRVWASSARPALPRRHRRGQLEVRRLRTSVGNPACRLAIHERSFSRVGPGVCVRGLQSLHPPVSLAPCGEREDHKGRRKTVTHTLGPGSACTDPRRHDMLTPEEREEQTVQHSATPAGHCTKGRGYHGENISHAVQ
jgi:hypothetical protein